LARVLSLTVRLYANMFASDMLTLVWFSLVPIAIPSIFLDCTSRFQLSRLSFSCC